VATGTTVTWVNNDSITHTTTSNGGTWNGNLAPGASFSFTFAAPGTYPYHCTIHPNMIGTITVQ
jgi:plastocyanin